LLSFATTEVSEFNSTLLKAISALSIPGLALLCFILVSAENIVFLIKSDASLALGSEISVNDDILKVYQGFG